MRALSLPQNFDVQPAPCIIRNGANWAAFMAKFQNTLVIPDNLPAPRRTRHFQENQMVSLQRNLFIGKNFVFKGSVGIVMVAHKNGRLFDVKFFSEEIVTLTISHLDLAPVL